MKGKIIMSDDNKQQDDKKIFVSKNGPYVVSGHVPLVRKSQVVSEYGEPLTWQIDHVFDQEEEYYLCRCGASKKKPFCDGSHRKIKFDGTESAETNNFTDRQVVFQEGTGVTVKRDISLCMSSGFCGNRVTNIMKMIEETDDTQVRALLMAMIERCPSGSYSYSIEPDSDDIEPDLPKQIAVTSEMSDDGVIAGPLWVTGNVPVERSDGQPFETRNRVTLCRCGKSNFMPLCDGTHRDIGFKE